MPIPTPSRAHRAMSPPATSITPARPGHRRAPSTLATSSYSPTVTSGGHQSKLNVVTRVAIEGKAKQGQDGASIKMYLKLSIPLDSVTPASTIPLFPEENVKILTSQVHPLDNHSVPYNFSSTVSPLLNNAARALNLPARSSESFYSAFNLPQSPGSASIVSSSSRSSKDSATENIPPVDNQFTGHILVSGYSISYVLPKVFPSRHHAGSPSDNETETLSRSSYRSRRASIGEKNTVQFMAAVDMWVPYVSRPPRSPYLLSIPTPRCLHNHIRLRIFPPSNTSSSFASLSSLEDEGNAWDLMSDPHVTRSGSNRLSRTNSYTHFADDESSDSSTTGFSDGCGIQGTFPSAERIRVRWAKPQKTLDVPGGGSDGRRRVGVKDAQGEMTCTVLGKMRSPEHDAEGVLMNVQYKGTCKGVWFPGVATFLGLDVGLVAKGSDVSWVNGVSHGWDISGDVGYTGFDVGTQKNPTLSSRNSSFDASSSPQIAVSSASGTEVPLGRLNGAASRTNSTSSTSSLLRAPLPAQHVAEYSFEGSVATLASQGTMSSISSLPTTSPEPESTHLRPPGVPITLHVNMNELLPPSKNIFSFTIAGTVLVTPRATLARINGQSSSDSGSSNSGAEADFRDPTAIVLPRFTVLAADSESISTIVRNEIENISATIEVYNSSGDIYRDAKARKTVLQKGAFTNCEDGGRIALKTIPGINTSGQSFSRPRTPNGPVMSRASSGSSLQRMAHSLPSKKYGCRLIPSVTATVTALSLNDNLLPNAYAVRVCLTVPVNAESEYLEFGLAESGSQVSTTARSGPPKVHITSASVDGVAVQYEVIAAAKQGLDGTSVYGVPFEEMSGKDWVSWIKVPIGAQIGEQVVVDYIVKHSDDKTAAGSVWKGKRTREDIVVNVFLPSFTIPVGRLEVKVDPMSGLDFSLQTNLDHQQSVAGGRRLLHFSLKEFFYPHLSLNIHRSTSTQGGSLSGFSRYFLFTWTIILLVSLGVYHLDSNVRQLGQSLDGYFVARAPGWDEIAEPYTVTRTIYASTETQRWFAAPSAESVAITSSASLGSDSLTSATYTLSPEPTTPTHPRQTETRGTSLSATSYKSILEQYGLLPLQQVFSYQWRLPDSDDLQLGLDKVVQTLEVVWQMFRRVYHYPLDPP
ncbi:hypothetical protein BDQ12DRAFT_597199 [Crucibulum laeve]|uniref:Uncharacterized protein n=1 Tax=Crucibulum laeve TaxID=68775 RepID=A0A5C3MB29_9AGAR|nr:hypothetical protein BDQ12DRAFT_597199 [Crucibulum laeve]